MKRNTIIISLFAAALVSAFRATPTAAFHIFPKNIPIDQEHFPDKDFREYLSAKECDRNQNGILEITELSQITELTSESIEKAGMNFFDISMEGFENLTELQKLELHMDKTKNSEKLMKVDISPLTRLTSLKVSTNSPDDSSIPVALDLSENPQLKELSVTCDCLITALPEECGITSYELSCWYYTDCSVSHNHPRHDENLLNAVKSMPELDELTITNFQKVSLDTSANPVLRKLTIKSGSERTSVKLDVTGNPVLTDLTLENCTLRQHTLDLSACTFLRNLTMKNPRLQRASAQNGLSFLDLQKCYAENINIDEIITDAAMDTGGYLDLTEIPGWNPDRVKEIHNFHEEKGRLYPLIQATDRETKKTGTILYYLDSDKTIPVSCRVTINNCYSPEMITSLKITEQTSDSITCTWEKVKRPADHYVVYIQSSKSEEVLQRIILDSSADSATIKGLTPGKSYKVIVRASKTQDGRNYYSPYYEGYIILTPES